MPVPIPETVILAFLTSPVMYGLDRPEFAPVIGLFQIETACPNPIDGKRVQTAITIAINTENFLPKIEEIAEIKELLVEVTNGRKNNFIPLEILFALIFKLPNSNIVASSENKLTLQNIFLKIFLKFAALM